MKRSRSIAQWALLDQPFDKERLMSRLQKSPRLRPQARSFLDCLRDFLTPDVWKQAHQVPHRTHQDARWQLQPLVFVLLTFTWCLGDSQAERFETARAFCVACQPKRKRPGRTLPGWHKALRRLPVAVLRALAAGVRQRLGVWLQQHGLVEGFLPLGCDGSRLECPRSAELERRLGRAGKKDSAPTLWVTALVHLRTGVSWAWRLGKGTASERDHLRRLLVTVPANALIVADAGFVGYDLACALGAAGVSFLIRMSCQATLYTLDEKPVERFRDGLVCYWPEQAQNRQQRPLLVRLIRVRGKKKSQEVWLLTNVVKGQQLSHAAASRFYRWRWESEGFFRTFKRTLAKVKLQSRSVRLVHREAEGALLATQLLLAHGAQAVVRHKGAEAVCSPRRVLVEIRREIQGTARRRRGKYEERLGRAARERRPRQTPKQKRAWPRRNPHKAPKPPILLKLPKNLKARIQRLNLAC
jgi:Transposase DDE domain